LIIQTIKTTRFSAFLAGLEAIVAYPLLADGAAIQATQAAGGIAGMAIAGASIAKLPIAELASIHLIFRNLGSTLVTGSAIPVGETHVSRIGVVGMQDVGDEGKEIHQSALV